MISPNIGQDLAEPVAEVYREAELRILRRIVWLLSQDLEVPEWDVLQLGRLQLVRAEILLELQAVNPAAAAIIQQQLADAYGQGQASAFADAASGLGDLDVQSAAQRSAIYALAGDATRALESTQAPILRAVDDVYRRVVSDVSQQVLVGGLGRKDATQLAINRLLGKGLRGIETKRGTMDLGTYATMAVRTATARAAVQGHEDTMGDLGLDLVIIHPGPRHCDICDKWARKTLTRGTVTGPVTVYSATDGHAFQVQVDDTLSQARAGGWGHPNCRCNLEAYIPGVTVLSEAKPEGAWDQEQYDAQQRQRAIERQIRAWKTRQAIAIDPASQRAAQQRIEGWQAEQREHLAANPYLKRQSSREQITGTLTGNPTQAKTPPGSRPLRRGAQAGTRPA